mgnify:FL=1
MECFSYSLRLPACAGEGPGQRTGFRSEHIQCFGKSPLYWLFFMGAYGWGGIATSAERHFRLFILLPEYHRSSTGLLWLTTYKPNNILSVSGGVRYDYGYIGISPHEDVYLADYLRRQGYDDEQVESYKWNSHAVRKHFGDYSFSLGLVWTPSVQHMVKVNIGRSFRLPGANELAANGVHHGTSVTSREMLL